MDAGWHLKHQVAFQENTVNAVSKTINFPQNASIKDISEAFIKIWKWKTKEITVDRNESNEQVIYQGAKIKKDNCHICIL